MESRASTGEGSDGTNSAPGALGVNSTAIDIVTLMERTNHLATKECVARLRSALLRWQIGILITAVVAACSATTALVARVMMP